ncbi:MAG: hypothetical protein ACR2OZ_10235 [Verrucomicrobiales bacterium]
MAGPSAEIALSLIAALPQDVDRDERYQRLFYDVTRERSAEASRSLLPNITELAHRASALRGIERQLKERPPL